ncbi:MAG: DUF3606 domain-containing protein [Ferruginibacter sp.]
MPDTLNQHTQPERSLINMHEKWEVIYWAKKWNISEEALHMAAKQARSSSAEKIHDAAIELGLIDR